MDKYLNKIMIIDGSYVMHRSLKTPGLAELETSKGMKTGGVFGALRIIQSEMKKFPSYFPIVCFDKGLSSRRTALYPDYKANRQRQEADQMIQLGILDEPEDNYLEEYHRQRNDLITILKALGIPSLLLPGWEGDDLMYLLSTVCNEGVVVSDDKDMIQLVSPTIKIDRSMRKEIIEWGTNEEYHHPRFTIMKSIIGDGSDNIVQVASGVGGSTADKLAMYLQESEDPEKQKELLEKFINDDNQKQALRTKAQKVLDNWDQYLINYQLINLRLVEAPVGFEEMIKRLILSVIGHVDIMKVYQLLGMYELKTIFPDQIIGMLAVSSSNVILEVEE